MKKPYPIIIFSFVFFFLVIGSSFNISYLHSNSAIQYENPRNSADEIIIYSPENKTYSEPMDGYYPAAYGFENDAAGTNPQNWGTNEDSSTYIQVEEEFNGHKKVLSFLDQSGSGNCESWRDVGSQTNGYVEYWVAVENIATLKLVTLTLRDGGVYGTVAFGIQVRTDYINPWGSTDHVCDLVAQQWYHIRLEFDCSTDIGDIYVNGIYNGFYSFVTDVPSIDCLRIETSAGDFSPEKVYYDAFGASWDQNYEIGDNLKKGLLLTYSNSIAVDWVGYSLNGQPNKTLHGVNILKIPSEGHYNIQLFCNDSFGVYYQSQLRYFSVDFSPIYPSIPLDLSFIIYIIIGILITAGIFIYLFLIKPKNVKMQVLKQQKQSRQTEVKGKQKHDLQKRRKEESRKVIDLETQKRKEEENALINKLRKVIKVSKRLKIELLRDYLKIDETLFNEKIFDWADEFGFKIDGDYLLMSNTNMNDFIDELETQFRLWHKREEIGLDKL